MASSVIGIMSGSSLDGIDMALCHFDAHDGLPEWSLGDAQTVAFTPDLDSALRHAPSMSGYELMKLDADLGIYIGKAVAEWIAQAGLKADCIASHGHTIFHEPAHGFTTQIGSGAHIAFNTRIDTITSFRSADVAAGGQGAPFAPVADKALFPGYEAYINLGGIANASMLINGNVWKAWDICPCNQALNFLSNKKGQPYDKDGHMASQGKLLPEVVEKLIAMFPFRNGAPRGLSNAEVQNSWIEYLKEETAGINDLLASVTEAIASLLIQHLRPVASQQIKILVTGGGAHNTFLMDRLRALSGNNHFNFHLPSGIIIDYKECALMAYLGYLTMHGLPIGIHSMTGASRDTIAGAIYKAYG